MRNNRIFQLEYYIYANNTPCADSGRVSASSEKQQLNPTTGQRPPQPASTSSLNITTKLTTTWEMKFSIVLLT